MPDESDKQAKLLTVALELFRRSVTDSAAFLFANRDRRSTGQAASWAQAALAPDHPTSTGDSPRPFVPPVRTPPREQDAGKSSEAPKPSVPQSIPKAPDNPKPIPLAAEPPPTIKNVFGVAPPSAPAAQPDLPPIPLASEKKSETFSVKTDWSKVAEKGGFGLGGKSEDPTGKVSAFDRPISAIIVGPNPLPVRLDRAMQTAATTPRDKRPESESGAGVAKAIASRFLAVIGPLYALSTVLGQTNSGFGVFQRSINVLGATLAPILLPVFALLAAGIMTVADMIWAEMIPAMKSWYEWFKNNKGAVGEVAGGIGGIAATVGLGRVLGGGGGGLGGIGSALKGGAARFGLPFAIGASVFEGGTGDYYAGLRGRGENKLTSGIGALGGGLMDVISQPLKMLGITDKTYGEAFSERRKKEIAEFRAKNGEPGTPGTPGTPGAKDGKTNPFGQLFDKNLQLVIESLSREMGPKASYTGVAEAAQSAQIAALNADPIEMQAANRIIQSIQEFQRVFGQVANKQEPGGQINRRAPDTGDNLRRR